MLSKVRRKDGGFYYSNYSYSNRNLSLVSKGEVQALISASKIFTAEVLRVYRLLMARQWRIEYPGALYHVLYKYYFSR